MRAAQLQDERRIVITEVENPSITKPDQALIHVKTVGVCGSEVHAFEGTHPYRKAPVILGHEVAGDVVAVGDAVTAFKAGARVIVDPQWTCGACDYCRNGMPNLCRSKKVLGTDIWPGGFGEYVVSPHDAVFHLPDTLSYAQGSVIEPLTVGVHVVRQSQLQAGESVAVLGVGSIGGLTSGVCRAFGAEPVIAADIREHCLAAARERMGAMHDFLLPDDDFVSKVKALTGGESKNTIDAPRLSTHVHQSFIRNCRLQTDNKLPDTLSQPIYILQIIYGIL